MKETELELEVILKQTYQHFNDKNIDATLTMMHPEVNWPNGMEGGIEHGHGPCEITGQDSGKFLTLMLNPLSLQ